VAPPASTPVAVALIEALPEDARLPSDTPHTLLLYEELVSVVAAMQQAHAELAAARDEAELRSRTDALTAVFGATTDERPHGPGRPREGAIEELRRRAGAHFDREVVEALVTCLDDEQARLWRRLAAHGSDRAGAA
jgi:hypothetical protein